MAYLFAGLVPGLFAYAAYSYLTSKFGAFVDLAQPLSRARRRRAAVDPLSW